ncbi:MAG: serine hydrolase domain-containing protein, partial [Verrucomicrobiota bacterium]
VLQLLVELGAPGAAIAVIPPRGKPLITVHGFADAAKSEPITRFHHFRVGSISKLFVGHLALTLVDEGILDLEDPIAEWVTETPRGDQIRLLDLGRHTSGLASAIRNPDFRSRILIDPEHLWTPDEILPFAYDLDFAFDPGESWQYANTNTILLGLAIEAQTSTSLPELLGHHLAEPFALTSTAFDESGELPLPRARGYRHGKEGNPIGYGTEFMEMVRFNATFFSFAGNLYSTIEDLAACARPILKGDRLSPESRAIHRDWIARKDGYGGYGFCLERWDGLVGHRGDVPAGFQAVMALEESSDTAFVVLTNLSNAADGRMPADSILALLREQN